MRALMDGEEARKLKMKIFEPKNNRKRLLAFKGGNQKLKAQISNNSDEIKLKNSRTWYISDDDSGESDFLIEEFQETKRPHSMKD